jgi:signal transduction histidine kinase
MRRAAPVVVLALLLALLLGSYVAYTRAVVIRLRRDAARLGTMYARVLNAQADTSAGAANAAIFDLVRQIDSLGVPIVVTDPSGHPAAASSNLPVAFRTYDDPRLAAYARVLDRQNPPVALPGGGLVHYGDSPLVRSLRYIPVIQALLLVVVLGAGVYALRTRSRAEREHVWAGMARETAHQLATPMSSLSGWIELLGEHADDPTTATAIRHMLGDLERLERVAHRFERIGRPPRRERVDLCELAARVAAYFQARVPTLARRVAISARCDGGPVLAEGDPVLLEWALEALAKNAVDALAGRGGTVEIAVERLERGGARVRVADDGPGVPRELRARIFEPGFSTKESGWGIGLSLARRIIEESHGGRLVLVPTDRGATFDVILET